MAEQFMGGLDEKKPVGGQPAADVGEQVNRLSGRVRGFERSLSDMRDMLRFLEDRMNRTTKGILDKQKALDGSLHDLADKLDKLHLETSLIVKELPLTAKKEDVEVVRRILEIIKPTRMITQDRAEKLVNEILVEKGLVKVSEDVPEDS